MSNFTVLYPSRTLARIFDPAANVVDRKTIEDIRNVLKDRLKPRLEQLKRYQGQGESQRWYWAAPLLLDLADSDHSGGLHEWFNDRLKREQDRNMESDKEETSHDGGAKEAHWAFLENCAHDPHSAHLGPMPGDLADVLVDIALGSPSVCTLRTYNRLSPHVTVADNMLRAAEIGDAFVTLYNKPESIEVIRGNSARHERPFWRQALEYGVSGCLQAVVDEFFHLVKEQTGDIDAAHERFRGVINLRVAGIHVDSLQTFRNGKARQMRCHYGVEFGSQRMEREDGSRRAKGLREVFNSPFRPFLLATTSIGQEGLDFHQYCRRVVHWNVPSNPVDFEQREGRINRYKGLVIRQRIANAHRNDLKENDVTTENDLWSRLFEIAVDASRSDVDTHASELVPYWHFEKHCEDDPYIERIIPLYPYSTDEQRLEKVLEAIAIYRLAFGQPRQAELVEHLLKRELDDEEIRTVIDRLMIDLSPIRYMSTRTP